MVLRYRAQRIKLVLNLNCYYLGETIGFIIIDSELNNE